MFIEMTCFASLRALDAYCNECSDFSHCYVSDQDNKNVGLAMQDKATCFGTLTKQSEQTSSSLKGKGRPSGKV